MSIAFWNHNPQLSESALAALERQLGVSLPLDYVAFMRSHNGGEIEPQDFAIPEIGAVADVSCFYGIGIDNGIEKIIGIFRGRLPKMTIPIGGGTFGNEILLDIRNGCGSIYYWDTSGEFEQTSEDSEPYRVAGSFSEFIRSLRAPDPAR